MENTKALEVAQSEDDFNDLCKLSFALAAGLVAKPCPFCGGEAEAKLEKVECKNCGATTHTWMRKDGCYSGFSAWQHRVADKTTTDLRAQLAERDAQLAEAYDALEDISSVTMADARNNGHDYWLEKCVVRAHDAKLAIEAMATRQPTQDKGDE